MDASTTAFLLAETLAEQNMSEEQIMKAMDSLQWKTQQTNQGLLYMQVVIKAFTF